MFARYRTTSRVRLGAYAAIPQALIRFYDAADPTTRQAFVHFLKEAGVDTSTLDNRPSSDAVTAKASAGAMKELIASVYGAGLEVGRLQSTTALERSRVRARANEDRLSADEEEALDLAMGVTKKVSATGARVSADRRKLTMSSASPKEVRAARASKGRAA